MLKNYLKVTLRILRKQAGYVLLNVAGLAVGLTCFVFILLFIRDERSYDRFHPYADRTFRLVADLNLAGRPLTPATTPAPWGPALKAEYPAVVDYARLNRFAAAVLVRRGDRRFYEKDFLWADPGIFRLFGIRLLHGDPASALAEPSTVVLTEATARKYFGDENPLGRTITVDEKRTYTVTGVLAQPPPNMHLRFDFLASFSTLADQFREQAWRLENWGYHAYFTYVLLQNPEAAARLAADFPAFIRRHSSERLAALYERAVLEPVSGIYLHSKRAADAGPRSDAAYIRIFAAIALLVLLIAAINFINLATARAAGRAREVGVRKVLGARRMHLVQQFLGESVLTALAAALLALMLVPLGLPFFNHLAGKALTADYLSQPGLPFSLLAAALLVGLGAGLYPAFYLSRFSPAGTTKGGPPASPGSGSLLRRLLVVAQVALSVFLLIATAVVYQQFRFFQHQELGFEQDHLVVIPMHDLSLRERYESVKAAFRQSPQVVQVGVSSSVPGAFVEQHAYRPDGRDEPMTLPMLSVDADFVEAMGIRLSAGRSFSEAFRTDTAAAFLINEALVEKLGWADPVGRPFEQVAASGTSKKGTVIGVVEDFHLASLHQPIDPVVLHVVPERFNFFVVRIRPEDAAGTLAFLKAQWHRLAPDWPFQYSFLGDDMDALYAREARLAALFAVFASIAILIACLGLFGLAAFTAEQRTKEIGIRKVLGASSGSIAVRFAGSFVRLVLAAVAVASPLAYLVMDRWLQDFAYRIEIRPDLFLIAGLAALLIALLTVGYQTLRAARLNPAESLRYE